MIDSIEAKKTICNSPRLSCCSCIFGHKEKQEDAYSPLKYSCKRDELNKKEEEPKQKIKKSRGRKGGRRKKEQKIEMPSTEIKINVIEQQTEEIESENETETETETIIQGELNDETND